MPEYVQPKIGIILVHINSYGHTSLCLKSLRDMTYRNAEIVVVDNGSTDGSAARLRNEFPEATYLRNETNEGFTGGCNTGIDYAMANGCGHILLLNNDTVVTPQFLEPLVERLESDPMIGAVSGKIYYYPPAAGGKDKIIWYAGTYQKWHTGYFHRGESEEDHGQYDTAQETAYASGCLMLMNGDLIRKIGGLSEDYFMYWEESDWCMRARELGYSSWYEPRAIIYHNFHSAILGKETPLYMYMQYRNAFIYAKRHYHGTKRLQFILLFPVHLINRCRLLLKGGNIKGLKSMFLGIIDFFKGWRGRQGLVERGFLKKV
jgi:GT2 family glycosyltransferase